MSNSIKPKINFEQQQILPVGSFMLVLICAIMFWQSASAVGLSAPLFLLSADH